MLQAQDGTFYGNGYNGMIHLDQSGNVNWSVPDDSPQIATADGGVIGASGITYDSQGRATGQIANMPIYAWTGDAYQDDPGQAQQLASTAPDVATSFWPGGDAQSSLPGANASGTSTAYQSIEQTLYMRIFAPWYAFGPDYLANINGFVPYVIPCLIDCFLGDNRTFTTTVDPHVVTARINGSIQLRFPGMVPVNSNHNTEVYSDLTTAINRRPPNTGYSNPTKTITFPTGQGSGNFVLELKGADPLVLAPNIDDYLNLTGNVTTEPGQVCYSGNLSGDEFPNIEVFVINSKGEAKTLVTYATSYNRNAGPWTLLSPNQVNLVNFYSQCVPD